MRKRLGLLFLGGVIFLFFVFFSYLVDKDLFTKIDFDTTVRLQDKISRKFDDLFSFFSVIGSFEIVSLGLLIALIIRKKIRGIIFLGLYVAFHVIEIYGKNFVEHLPPPEFLLRTKRFMEFPQFHVRAEYSYPSGHAGRTAFISTILIFFLLRTKKLSGIQKLIIFSIIAIFDIIMFTSRIYLGEHWASDILGGIALGVALAVIGEVIY